VQPADPAGGRPNLTVSLLLAGLAWLSMALQEILLYTRPTPYGGPYVEDLPRYFPHTLVFNLFAAMLVSTPFLLFWLLWRRGVRGEVAAKLHYLQLGLLLLTVALDHIDNEVMRFMGIHLSFNLVHTYFKVNAWGSDMLHIFLTDRGGPGLPFLILLVVPLGLWWTGRRVIRRAPSIPLLRPWPVAALVSLAPLLAASYVYLRPGADFRKRRTQPAIFTLYQELGEDWSSGSVPAHFDRLVLDYQRRWLEQSGDTAWRFTDPEHPLLRVPLTPAAPIEGKPWNVIYIQLETFRGWNTGHLRPDVSPSATPFLDGFARDSASAFWRRHLSMGPPTVNGFMSGTCSVKPHSARYITTAFTYSALECLPPVLRRHGYAAELFTGFDPDWDGQTIWLRRWYEDYRLVKGGDREVFRQAAERIRKLGAGPRPFLMSVVSENNHYPFRSFEPKLTLDPVGQPITAIRNTMRITDDVLREFIESLRQEPWFGRTVVVITGDHGYNLGEHGPAGQASGWRESVWVPLVIHAAHPRLPRGAHDEWATLLDIAPTVTDLVGIRDPNPWMGASLLIPRRGGSFALSRGTNIFGEQGRYSMVVDPANGKGLLYDAVADPLQRHDISAAHPEVVTALRRQAEDDRRLLNFLLEANRVWPSTTSDLSGSPEPRGDAVDGQQQR
jgi:phosphoglycerol transferase MdoB-like AlkP superfamily enzyme